MVSDLLICDLQSVFLPFSVPCRKAHGRDLAHQAGALNGCGEVQLNQIGAYIPAEGARPALGILPPLGYRLGYRFDAQAHGLHHGCDVGAKRTASARSGALGVSHGLAQAQGQLQCDCLGKLEEVCCYRHVTPPF